jgi:hypothetical protein
MPALCREIRPESTAASALHKKSFGGFPPKLPEEIAELLRN